jgi:sec-independent protein translocase protein TatC
MGKNPEGRMPLIEHFGEFRKRIFKSALGISVFGIFGWYFYERILVILAKPICNLNSAKALTHCGTLYINGVLGPIDLKFKISLIFGVIFSSPVWLYQLWAFISPALHKRERRNSLVLISFAIPFFGIGSYIGYRILPFAVRILLGFTPINIENLIKFDDYLNFVAQMILVFGIAFELPIFLTAMNFAGLVSGKTILKPWRLAIFAIMLFSAIFTPTGDPFTMLLLATPLIALYLISGAISMVNDRRKARKANA